MIPWASQLELCKALVESPAVARELNGVITPKTLTPPLGWIATGACELHAKYKSKPTEGLMREWLSTKLDGVLLESALENVTYVHMSSTPPEKWAVNIGHRLSAESALNLLTSEMPQLVEEGKFDEILHRTRQASLLASPMGELTVGAGSEGDVQERQHETGVRIGTGIYRLDKYLNGGLKRGEMGHILGRKGGGKSHALTHLGAMALRHDLHVLHATLEMSDKEVRARYDRHLVGATGLEFSQALPSKYAALQDWHSRLSVLSKKGLNLGGLVSTMEKMDPKPDVVIVDYLQLMTSGGMAGDGDYSAMRRMALGRLSQDLHDVAQEHEVALWTAYQTNRAGMMAVNQAGVLDITHYSEAIDAAWPAAVIVSLNQTVDEAANRQGRIFVAENRGGEKLRTIECEFDWRISKIMDINDPILNPNGVI